MTVRTAGCNFSRRTKISMLLFIGAALLVVAYVHMMASHEMLLPKPEQRTEQMAGTAICTMVQNEDDAVSEWLAYHHGIIGVPRFYIYSDRTTDSTYAAVESYIKRGVVIWVDWNEDAALPIWKQLTAPDGGFDQINWDGDRSTWPSKLSDFFSGHFNPFYKQYLSNRDCWERVRASSARWALSLDVDEYLVGKTDGLGRATIPERLADAELDNAIGCEFMHHRNFGSAGHMSLPLGALRTGAMVSRGREPGANGKSWVRVDSLNKNVGRHYFAEGIHKPGNGVLNGPNGQRRCRDNDVERVGTGVVVHHYFTGDYRQFAKRRPHQLKVTGQAGAFRNFWDSFDEVYDGTMRGYSTELYHILLTTDPWWTNRTVGSRRT